MPDARMIREQVDARIAELEAILEPLRAECEQLRAVAASFGSGAGAARGGAAGPPVRAVGRPRTKVPATSGAPPAGSSRAQQAVELITARPGITAADMAQALGISRNYLYRVLPRLEARGVVTKQGMGYHPAAPAAD